MEGLPQDKGGIEDFCVVHSQEKPSTATAAGAKRRTAAPFSGLSCTQRQMRCSLRAMSTLSATTPAQEPQITVCRPNCCAPNATLPWQMKAGTVLPLMLPLTCWLCNDASASRLHMWHDHVTASRLTVQEHAHVVPDNLGVW